jgi:putative heme iron utilization protein
MKNKGLELKLSEEILTHIESKKSLLLSSLDENGVPYISYAPFAYEEDCFYLLLSDIAIHGKNLALNAKASVMVIEDEDTACELYARIRVSYQIEATLIEDTSSQWEKGIQILTDRLGDRVLKLSELSDFKLFKLTPITGRYVKGFGKAYTIEGKKLGGTNLSHLTVGHQKKPSKTLTTA